MLEPDRLAASARYESAPRHPMGPEDEEELREAFGRLVPLAIGLFILVVVVGFLPTPLIAPLVAAYGGFSLFAGFRAYQRRRVMQHTPTAKVTAAPIGPVELHGTLGTASPVTAPFSGKSCVYWRVVIWERQRSGSKTKWRHVCQVEQFVESLWLEDETGRMVLLPRGVELAVDSGEVWQVHAGVEGDQGVSESGWKLLESRGYWRRDAGPGRAIGAPLGGDRRLEIRELCLEVGGAAYVLGTIARAGDVAFSPRDANGPVVHVQSDTYGDGSETPIGRISLVALADVPRGQWETVRHWLEFSGAAGRRVDGAPLGQPAPGRASDGGSLGSQLTLSLPPGIRSDERVVWRGDGGHPFVIAAHDETELDQHLLARTQYGLIVGTAALLWGLWRYIPTLTR